MTLHTHNFQTDTTENTLSKEARKRSNFQKMETCFYSSSFLKNKPLKIKGYWQGYSRNK